MQAAEALTAPLTDNTLKEMKVEDYEGAAVRYKSDVGDRGGVLVERHKAVAARRRPQLHLGVAAASRDDRSSGRVGECMYLSEEVALLPKHIALGAPLPHQQLTQGRAAEGQPLGASHR